MIDMNGNDVVCFAGDSLTNGNSDTSVKWTRAARDLMKPVWARQYDGLAGVPGAKAPLITMYDVGMPNIVQSGNAGEPIETLTANFLGRVGSYTPNVLIIGLGANNFTDAIPGVLNPKVDALIAKVVDPTQYSGRRVPNGWIWWGCAWRGSEVPGGANQAALLAMNAVIKTKVETAGGIFVDIQNIWLSQTPVPPAGTYTVDATHFTAAGAAFVARNVFAQINMHVEMRG